MRGSKVLIFAALMGAIGCASTQPSDQLVAARRAYQEAAQGPADRLVPARLYEARAALVEAEEAQREDPDSLRAVSLAYIAERRAQEATALAEQSQSRYQIAQAKQREQEVLRNQRDVAQLSLEEAQKELAQVRDRLRATGTELGESTDQLRQRETDLARREQELQAERAARAQAEQTAKEAVASLDKLAKIQQDSDRTVITLSGQVLFASGKATLLPTARMRLAQVATALKTQTPETIITVNGYTDSIGDAATNMQLSRERADAVRDFFVSQGIDASRIRSVGHGQENPIASNDTPEGRANNRRVELVLEDQGQAGKNGKKLSAR